MKTSRWAITPSVLVGFGVAILLVLVGGLAALYEQAEVFRAGDRSRHTLEVMVELGRLRDALGDAEAGQRGYLLTGSDSYLESYERGRTEAPAELLRLRDLTQAEPRQQERLSALAPLLTSTLDELQRALDLHRNGDPASALAVIQAHAGKPTMDRIRGLLGEIEADESRQLGEDLATRAARRKRTRSMIAATTSGAVLVMLLSLVGLGRTGRERERAESRVRETEERLRVALSKSLVDSETRAHAVLDTTVSAIVSIDAEGRIETFNKAAELLFGYRAAEVIGQNVKLLMPLPYSAEHDGYLRRYLETGERRIIGIGREVTGLRRDGTTFPMDLAVADTVLDDEHIFTAVIRDLTREREAEERERKLLKQALQNERLADVGAMTARIAHDFGNPLAGLRMTAQRMLMLLRRDPLPADQLRHTTDRIVATTERLETLVGEFKEFSGEQRLHLRNIELPAFLQEVVTAWQQEAEERGIALEVELGDMPPSIRADQDKLRRVMDNLMKNALEAIDQGPGVVRVAVESHERESVSILVADTGPGIPEGMDVFALFETSKVLGTGLGLSICRQIVLAHGGGIGHARRLPAGTIFRIELPTHEPAQRL